MKNEAKAFLPTEYGNFQISVYTTGKLEHVLLVCGDVSKGTVLTRVHSKCLTGDTFLSRRCDCHEQLEKSMELIQENGSGVIIYLDQEGRGIGLTNKIKAYALQDQGLNTLQSNTALGFEGDPRDYDEAADILKDVGVKQIKLLTNNPEKVRQLSALGIDVTERVALEILPNEVNKSYLLTKKQHMGHTLNKV